MAHRADNPDNSSSIVQYLEFGRPLLQIYPTSRLFNHCVTGIDVVTICIPSKGEAVCVEIGLVPSTFGINSTTSVSFSRFRW